MEMLFLLLMMMWLISKIQSGNGLCCWSYVHCILCTLVLFEYHGTTQMGAAAGGAPVH